MRRNAFAVQPPAVPGDAGVEDRGEPVAIRTAQMERDRLIHLRRRVDLVAVERCLEVPPVGVGLLGEDRGAVVIGERLLDGIGVARSRVRVPLNPASTSPAAPPAGAC